MASQDSKTARGRNYDQLVDYIWSGVQSGLWSYDSAQRAAQALEDRKQEIADEVAEYDDESAAAKSRGQEAFAAQLNRRKQTFLKLLIENAGSGTLSPGDAEQRKKDLEALRKRATSQLPHEQNAQVVAFIGREPSDIINFISGGGLSPGGPDVQDPTRPARLAPNVKGVRFAAQHLLRKFGYKDDEIAQILNPQLTEEQYAAWVEATDGGDIADWADGITLEYSPELDRLFDQLRVSATSSQGQDVLALLEGGRRDNLQMQGFERGFQESEALLRRAEGGQGLTPEDLAKQSKLATSLALTDLAFDGITPESEILRETGEVGQDPRLKYSYDGDISTRAGQLALAKRAALAEDGENVLRMLEVAGQTLAAGFDSQGRPIRGRQSSDPLSSNPFIQPVLDRIQMTKDVQDSPLFYEIANSLGMNLAEGERPTTGQLNRVLRAAKRDKRRAYRPSGTFIEVDVVDRDRALEVQDGQFVSFVDAESGDFITLDEMQRRSEGALSDKEGNPVREFDLDDKGIRTLMGVALEGESADMVRELNKLYGMDPKKAAGSSVVVDLANNEVAVIGPDRVVVSRGTLNEDQVAAINDAALNSNVAHVATDPGKVREGASGSSLQSLDALSLGARYNGSVFAPPGTTLSMETPVRRVKGMAARQKFAGDRDRFVVMGAGREGEQILFRDIRGDMTTFDDLSPEQAAEKMGLTGAQAARYARRRDRRERKAGAEFKRGAGAYSSEPIAREKTPVQRALTPPPEPAPAPEAAPAPAAEPAPAPAPAPAPVQAPAPAPVSAPAPAPASAPQPAPAADLAPVFPPLADYDDQAELVRIGRIAGSFRDMPGVSPDVQGVPLVDRARSRLADALRAAQGPEEEVLVEEQIAGVVPGTRRP